MTVLLSVPAMASHEPLWVVVEFDERPTGELLDLASEVSWDGVHVYQTVPALAMRVSRDNLPLLAQLPGVKALHLGGIQVSMDEARGIVGQPLFTDATNLTGKGVVVAVLDTGIDRDHPDLVGRVIERISVRWVPGVGFAALPSEVPPGNGHGTHVAGIVAGSGASSDGRFRGIAPDVLLVDVEFIDATEGDISAPFDAPLTHALAALEWLGENHERLGVRIVQNSWGKPWVDGLACEDHLVAQAVRAATGPDLLWVFAAGNNGAEADINVPGCLPEVVTVGAVDKAGAVAEFSSRGPTRDGAEKPDLVAPGVDIMSTEPVSFCGPLACSTEPYGARSGTSMAAPMVTGMAALLAQAYPDMNGTELRQEVLSLAKGEWNADTGHGLATMANIPLAFRNETGFVPVGHLDAAETGLATPTSGARGSPGFMAVGLVSTLALLAIIRRRP